MAKYLTVEETRNLERTGKIPRSAEKPAPKDPSVKAIEGIGKTLADHLKVQERRDEAFRGEVKGILQTVTVALKDGREVTVEMPETKEWQEIDITVTRNNEDLISKLKMKKVK